MLYATTTSHNYSKMIHHLQRVSSTNDLAQGEGYGHGDIIWAEEQSAGRGQRGRNWISDLGENLTFTVVLSPKSLPIKEQFSLLRVTALSLIEALSQFGIEAKIKWTNDIYVGDKKICGVLIENRIEAGMVSKSIIGIGLNVNQIKFSSSLPNPTSMRCEKGVEFNREEVLNAIHSRLMSYASRDDLNSLCEPYHQSLYRLGELHTYRDSDGNLFTAKIIKVASTGELTLEKEDLTQCSYLFREVQFVI